jgi:ankyrin repeat protein
MLRTYSETLSVPLEPKWSVPAFATRNHFLTFDFLCFPTPIPQNHANCIKRLSKVEGIDVNSRNVVGWTALLWASANGSTEAVEALLACGADPNIAGQGSSPSSTGSGTTTPLQEARKSREPQKISKLLIRGGALF